MKPIPTETASDVGIVGKWLGAAAAGALLMYLLDPERGAARRSRAVSAVKSGAARTGATVDQALHSAGDRLGALTDSAADAISRGAGKLQAQAAPLLERVRHGAEDAGARIADQADASRERILREAEALRAKYDAQRDAERSHANAGRNRYDHDEHYLEGSNSGGLAGWLQDLGERIGETVGARRGQDSALLGGSLIGLLGVMRRNPAGLLIGLAGLALLMRSTGSKRYSVGSLSLPPTRHLGAPTPAEPAPVQPAEAAPSSPTLH
ncbi:apolipoprotein A1/A4/E family protein [Massilia sp. G4R7]|uniref:Apolipoprotein A1/A4/E family protein n=1 Tax=Massilia phyllostachyos TaxID=2898585 RepID=A0ABS8QBX3_9BURK|nr:apolipoprotein A1/A4/E family protein [Massilia phyllostachyos]MCD2518542.1 apolipoprotein A1/A4/E family protein [Massilia phyllostachyos]